MARDRLFQIKKWITVFFAFVIMLQAVFVCYASAVPVTGDVAIQLSQLEQLGRIMVFSIVLNLVVVMVAVYGVNISIVSSFRCNK